MEQNMKKEIITVTNAFKKYGQDNVLCGLNMTVESGSM